MRFRTNYALRVWCLLQREGYWIAIEQGASMADAQLKAREFANRLVFAGRAESRPELDEPIVPTRLQLTAGGAVSPALEPLACEDRT